jgi:hypothetical protein
MQDCNSLRFGYSSTKSGGFSEDSCFQPGSGAQKQCFAVMIPPPEFTRIITGIYGFATTPACLQAGSGISK